jgi:YVTN family beta-propeller protein
MFVRRFSLVAIILSVLFEAIALAQTSAGSASSSPGYRFLKKIPAGGEGGWDYLTLDPSARRLYVSRATRVLVFDADSGESKGEIPDTSGVHGIALAPELHRGFTSNGRSSTVTVFDTGTLKVLSEVKTTGENPDAILYDPASRRVFTFNGRGKNATAIDPEGAKVVGTIPLDGKPEFAVSDGKGKVYVNVEDKSVVDVIDPAALTVVNRWPLAPCEEPSGLAIDREHRRLFVGCSNKMMAMLDADGGKVLATVPIGEGVDANGFDPATGLAFASCGDGTLTVAHEDAPDRLKVVQNVETQRGARTMALDEKTHRVFLVTAQFGPRPSPTADQPRPRPPLVPGSFVLLVYGP